MNRALIYWAIVAIMLASAIGVRLFDPTPVVRLRLLAFDTLQQVIPRKVNTDYPVRIIDIDERSLASVGPWPWRREILADLVDRLTALGAHVIAFDFVFPGEQRNKLCDLPAKALTLPELTPLREKLQAYRRGDSRFAEAVANRPVVLGMIGRRGDDETAMSPRASFALLGDDPKSHIPTFAAATGNYGELQKAAKGLGALNWFPEYDQIVRRVPMLIRVKDKIFPSLTAETLRLALGADTIAIFSTTSSGEAGFGGEVGITSIALGEATFPTGADGQIWVAFTRHDPRRFRSAADVLAGKVARADIEGRLVLIGTSAPGLFDLRATPLEAALAGVEVHAQALEQLLSGLPLVRPDYSAGLEIAFMVLAVLALAAASYAVGALFSAVVGGLTVAAVLTISWWAFVYQGLLLDPTYPAIVATAVYIFATAFFYFFTERDKNQIRQAFAYYMAPSMVEQLTRQPDRLRLGGETRQLTIMFSDVRGFTSVAEQYRDNPRGLTQLMNRMLTPLTYCITERRGTIDKYIGDAIMAFWNAPLDDEAHARNGCDAALDMIARLDALNDERRTEAAERGETFLPLHIGIGIATGRAMVGNMGSDLRFDYSVLGDTVNLASRLEGLTRRYGVPILLAGETARRGVGALAALEIDRVHVRGREAVEPIWALLGDRTMAADPGFQKFAQGFSEARSRYADRQWSEAAAAFEAVRPAASEMDIEGLIDLFVSRIAEYEATPPPPDWDGATRMQG